MAIIEAIKWVFEKIGNGFSKLFGGIGDWFSDTFNLGGGSSSSTTNNNSSTVNHITVNTTASSIDIDALNKKLGGSYL